MEYDKLKYFETTSHLSWKVIEFPRTNKCLYSKNR